MDKLKKQSRFPWLKILIVCFSYIPLGLLITKTDFMLNFYYETLPLSDDVRMYWFDENFYNLLVEGLITVLIFILLIFRFKFKISENFNITKSTFIITLICTIISVCAVYYSYKNNDYPLKLYFGEIIKLLIGVSLFEKLIFRGFITNELFRMKKIGMKTPVAISISAILFGLMHLPAYFHYSEVTFGGAIFRFVFPTIIGVSYAIFLYYKKDIISLIIIHTASNICGSIAGQPFDIVFFVVLIIYTILLIPTVRKRVPFLYNR